MDNSDVKEIVRDEIKKFVTDSLDKEIKKILHNKNSVSREEMTTTIKDGMDGVFKLLWQRKDFWQMGVK